MRIIAGLFASLALLAGCGGGGSGGSAPPPAGGPSISGFSADRAAYFVGEQARLTMAFSQGTGRLEPDGITVSSGQTVTTPPLSTSIQYRLVVSDGARTVTRSLDLPVSYRDRFRAVAMPFSRGGHRAIHLPDDRVLVLGGEDTSTAFPDSIHAFDPATETFSHVGNLGTGRVEFLAIALESGDVLVAGGAKALTGAPNAELVAFPSGTVSATANDPVKPRSHAAATLLMDGRVFIAGGRVTSAPDNSIELYDPGTRRFSLFGGTLQVGRFAHTVTRIDQRYLLVYGGLASGPQQAPPELFDLATGMSTVLPAPEAGVRAWHRAITQQDGGVLIVGGEDYDQMPRTAVLRFDPASRTFSTHATLAMPRTATGVDRLVDGRLLVAGGVTGLRSTDITATSELLAASGTRSDGPAMNVPRRDHTVTRLNSGKLLVVGGLGTDLWPLASAELYE